VLAQALLAIIRAQSDPAETSSAELAPGRFEQFGLDRTDEYVRAKLLLADLLPAPGRVKDARHYRRRAAALAASLLGESHRLSAKARSAPPPRPETRNRLGRNAAHGPVRLHPAFSQGKRPRAATGKPA
jgi:hypothetical protein